jgi:hypothetical protein
MNLNLTPSEQEILTTMLAMAVALYAGMAKVEVSDPIKKLFNNNIFRVVFLSLLLIYKFDKAPSVAITVALVFLITMNNLNQQELRENFSYIEAFQVSQRRKQNDAINN